MKDFVHLHLHTQYSLLDGAILIDKLLPRIKELGMKSVAITDHGAMYGVVDFYKACKAADIHPVIGCEFYISPTKRTDTEYTRGQNNNYHLILLAENDIGFANLRKLATIAQLEGFYYRPRIDKEVLEKYHEGIIALSACIGGEIAQKILTKDYITARDSALEYERIMGKGNYFLEIQHNGITEQSLVNAQLINISEETGIPLVATCDCHYLNKGDHDSHTVLMAIQMGKTVENGMESSSELLYVQSPKEMCESFKSTPEALENTVKIAQRCNVHVDFGKEHLPDYKVPDGFTSETYLEHLAKEGLNKRLERVPVEQHDAYRQRLNMEMDVIRQKGYVGYFLIVWDFINFSRENDIPVGPGRGSGAGSLVAYSMRITDIDPIKLNLLFERFLNPERPSFPDFDIDFCVKNRDRVIKYVTEKYGQERVSQIVTFGKLSGRGLVKDVCRALNIPLDIAGKLSKTIPEAPGMTISKALKDDPTIESTFKAVAHGNELFKHVINLEGLLRQSGMHAAGVVIADKPLVEYIPLCRGKEGEVISQYEKGLLEKLGLVKFDFLGLANLTIIADTVDRIHRQVDPNFDISQIPYDDKDVYEMLARGESTGVFQFESDGMRRLMKKLVPTVLEDLIALNALYRPGPINGGMLDDFCDRKHGVKKTTYELPQLESILKETYGVIVYQEQVMEISRVVAGYSLGAADILRRAMGKKDLKEMEQQKKVFLEGDEAKNIPGARKLGIDVKIAEGIFDLMANFAEYGFNKSHSAAYAVIAYQTAYLRNKFSAQFLSASMSAEDKDIEKVVPYIDDARMLGIEVYPPDVNKSMLLFEYIPATHTDKDGIWFGLKAIRNVGEGAAEAIIDERNKNGFYKSIYDFCARIDLRAVNKKVMESLIYAGAFDCFGKKRRQHLQILESCIEQSTRKQKMKASGIQSIEDFLFDGEQEAEQDFYPDVTEIPDNELLSHEKAVLSIYFTSHPVMEPAKLLNGAFDTVEKVLNSSDGANVKVLGMIKSVKQLMTNKNKTDKPSEKMASFEFEDLTGVVDMVAFPRIYSELVNLIAPETILVAEGIWKQNGDRASVHVNSLYPLAEALEHHTDGMNITLELASTSESDIGNIYKIIHQHKGGMPVVMTVRNQDYALAISLPEEFRIKPSDGFFAQIKEYFGIGCCKVITDQVETVAYKFEEHYINDVEYEYDS